VAIPHVLVLLGPTVLFPLHVVFARLVATCPMLVLFVAMTVMIRALLGVQAILAIMCWGELVTVPDVLLLLNPAIFLPHHVAVTGFIATGPVLVLSPTSALWIVATQGLTAIISIMRAIPRRCSNHIMFRNVNPCRRCPASDRQQDCRPDCRCEARRSAGWAWLRFQQGLPLLCLQLHRGRHRRIRRASAE